MGRARDEDRVGAPQRLAEGCLQSVLEQRDLSLTRFERSACAPTREDGRDGELLLIASRLVPALAGMVLAAPLISAAVRIRSDLHELRDTPPADLADTTPAPATGLSHSGPG